MLFRFSAIHHALRPFGCQGLFESLVVVASEGGAAELSKPSRESHHRSSDERCDWNLYSGMAKPHDCGQEAV